MWAQLIKTATQGKDKNEIAHEGSGTTEKKTPGGDSAPPPRPDAERWCIYFINAYDGFISHCESEADKCIARSGHLREAKMRG